MSRPVSFLWTPSLDDDLVARFKAGERVKTIARALDRPVYIVDRRIEALRDQGRVPYRNRKWTPVETGRLLAALDAGARFTDHARSFGRSNGALREQANRARRAIALEAAQAEEDQLTLELRAA